MRKFTIQDRIILDDMVDMFSHEMNERQDEADLLGKRLIITREYWTYMIKEVQNKIDDFTAKKALSHSNKFRTK